MKIVVNIYGLHDRLRSGSWQVTLLISGTKLELGNTVHPRLSEPHLSEPTNMVVNIISAKILKPRPFPVKLYVFRVCTRALHDQS